MIMFTNLTLLRTSIFSLFLISLAGCEPRTSVDYNRRGVAWFEAGEYEKAVADFEEAHRLDPDNPVIQANMHLNRGLSWDEKGEYQKAIDEYSDAIRFDSTDEQLYRLRGVALYNLGEPGKATADFSRSSLGR